MSDKLCLVYITAPDIEEAKNISRIIVEERFAAGANIIDGITSFYWWNGGINEVKECIIMAKTKASLVDKLTEKIKAIHSYSCPCIVSLDIAAGNAAFLNWISSETQNEF